MGFMPGMADLVFLQTFQPGMKTCPVCFVELKLQKGKLSRQQKAWKQICRDRNYPYHVVRTSDTGQPIEIIGNLVKKWQEKKTTSSPQS